MTPKRRGLLKNGRRNINKGRRLGRMSFQTFQMHQLEKIPSSRKLRRKLRRVSIGRCLLGATAINGRIFTSRVSSPSDLKEPPTFACSAAKKPYAKSCSRLARGNHR